MSRLRVAVVGAGNWGRNHARSLSALSDVELTAVCDVDAATREAMARQYPGVLVTESFDQALEGVDAAVIATPAATHAELAGKIMERGLPVLVEKPFALSTREAEAIAEVAEARGVPVLVGHLLVFHPAVERLKTMIASGDLGEIYYLYSQRVNLGQVRPDENALWSFGPHDISVALELLAQVPVRVTAQGRSFLQPGIEDVVFMTMEFASGVIGHVQMSWLDPHKVRRLTVVGSQKMVVFDDMQAREKLKIYDKGVDRPPQYDSYGESLAIREGDISIPRVPNVEPLSAELQHFVRVARRQEPPRVGVRDGVIVVRLLEAASESMRLGGAVVDVSPQLGAHQA
ncbi:MAG: Gfo/Idh/MocA family oxidoreductase [Gemmatimonadales bacterium]|nr:Gfo/Idh/MocA family oxidoreductase [Gemmatimonadales bacterium]NIN13511.1 Gfo/Idh/MocA family oxidoreductase [Gemmatimonadales bacterium]NIN51505.1 Gfo/Idh/MocA family oxidoreductase [Gemmatimonadales bacterium]NIP08969.1 Gfo/Idh/MocA family oxidoreductase [Gemmatimonadales bacterium]NIR03747.1 Gfo/Idh/MocA family oxidoreductase [Gemmatimonadales bacterium]